ncbi:unnamed protein product [Nippostrongylus brasiliensis]|uniref:C-type lectin domain-containing protein n=1 Tax=Nippostrongylus brasiliensis TaxID=27835 RepID=A0A158QZ09_NIPBR|nr:unnamed protein product [Nippostrongylus brasiliensis]
MLFRIVVVGFILSSAIGASLEAILPSNDTDATSPLMVNTESTKAPCQCPCHTHGIQWNSTVTTTTVTATEASDTPTPAPTTSTILQTDTTTPSISTATATTASTTVEATATLPASTPCGYYALPLPRRSAHHNNNNYYNSDIFGPSALLLLSCSAGSHYNHHNRHNYNYNYTLTSTSPFPLLLLPRPARSNYNHHNYYNSTTTTSNGASQRGRMAGVPVRGAADQAVQIKENYPVMDHSNSIIEAELPAVSDVVNGPFIICPDGYKRYANSCYYVEMQKMDYESAVRNCEKMGASVFSASSLEEWNEVMAMTPAYYWTWTGIQQEAGDVLPQFKGADRMDTSNINWLMKPFSSTGNGWSSMSTCAAFYNMNMPTSNYVYFYPCSLQYHSICQRNLSQPQQQQQQQQQHYRNRFRMYYRKS